MLRVLFVLSFVLSFAGCGGGGGGGTDIAGRVVSPYNAAITGATVTVGDQSTTTASDGSFSLSDVPSPYTLVVTNGTSSAFVFVGMSRGDPTLEVSMGNVGPNTNVSFEGTASGGAGFPQPANTLTRASYGANVTASGLVGTVMQGADDTWGLTAGWSGAPTADFLVYALQMTLDPATGIPTSFPGFGTLALDGIGGPVSNLAISMSPVPTNTVSGVLSAPMGFNGSTGMHTRIGRAYPLQIFSQSPMPPVFSYPIPGTTLIDTELHVIAGGPMGATRAFLTLPPHGAQDLIVDLPMPATFVAPASGSMNVDVNTIFEADAFSGRLYRFTFHPPPPSMTEFGQGPRITVITDRPQATIPDLGALGLALPADANYRARVETLAPFASIDAATGPGGTSFAGPIHYQTEGASLAYRTAP